MTLAIGAFGDARLPAEKIVETNWYLTAYLHDSLDKAWLNYHTNLAVRKLACGHEIVSKAKTRAHCPYCQLMWDLGLDWDRFRNGDHHDPLRDLTNDELLRAKHVAMKNGLKVHLGLKVT